MRNKYLAMGLALLMLLGVMAGCAATPAAAKETAPAAREEAAPAETAEEPELPAEPVTLTVAGSWEDCRALDEAANAFTEKYPNCTIVYEYLQDYYASLEKRMSGDEAVDLFFTTNIQSDSELLPYALDLMSRDDIDLTDTFDGLIKNFMFREESGENTKLYAIPLGAEMRGLYVNKTLLASVGLDVPKDQASLLEACRVLKEAGYIPFHGNPGDFSQTLMYPWICNLIANADDPQAAYDRVNSREPGLSEMFREPYEFLYSLVENDYYDYKRAQTELNLFNDTTDEAYARDFLNIQADGDGWVKADDVGQVAFMPSPMSRISVMDRTKEDYHSNIDYVFIMAPVGVDGGFAYMSPSHGIAVNKDSQNIDWGVKFLDFLFTPENNAAFAETFNCIPNTKEAFSYITTLFDVPDDHISHLGQVTFDYGFYAAITPSLIDTSKANNPKYMQEDGTLYPLDYYLQELEAGIKGE